MCGTVAAVRSGAAFWESTSVVGGLDAPCNDVNDRPRNVQELTNEHECALLLVVGATV